MTKNPILQAGEPGVEFDTGRLKLGNGTSRWKDLPYTDGSYSFSPDGNSLVVDNKNQLMLYGFKEALVNYIPSKGEDGKIKWIELHSVATSGNISDLQQSSIFSLYGGSANLNEDFIRNGFNVSLQLRRDNDYNYAKIKDKFVPAKGEICLVDTVKDGLRAVCGDGKTPFGELQYLDEIIVKGYYFDNKFYKDKEMTVELPAQTNKVYICIKNVYTLYIYDGVQYHQISGSAGALPTATSEVPGIMKLYNSTGNNEDGTMTQKAITDELDDKVEIELNKDEELLIFTY